MSQLASYVHYLHCLYRDPGELGLEVTGVKTQVLQELLKPSPPAFLHIQFLNGFFWFQSSYFLLKASHILFACSLLCVCLFATFYYRSTMFNLSISPRVSKLSVSPHSVPQSCLCSWVLRISLLSVFLVLTWFVV